MISLSPRDPNDKGKPIRVNPIVQIVDINDHEIDNIINKIKNKLSGEISEDPEFPLNGKLVLYCEVRGNNGRIIPTVITNGEQFRYWKEKITESPIDNECKAVGLWISKIRPEREEIEEKKEIIQPNANDVAPVNLPKKRRVEFTKKERGNKLKMLLGLGDFKNVQHKKTYADDEVRKLVHISDVNKLLFNRFISHYAWGSVYYIDILFGICPLHTVIHKITFTELNNVHPLLVHLRSHGQKGIELEARFKQIVCGDVQPNEIAPLSENYGLLDMEQYDTTDSGETIEKKKIIDYIHFVIMFFNYSNRLLILFFVCHF